MNIKTLRWLKSCVSEKLSTYDYSLAPSAGFVRLLIRPYRVPMLAREQSVLIYIVSFVIGEYDEKI